MAGTKKNRQSNEINGVIIPVEWNENGNPVSISLFTFDEEEHRIDMSQGIGGEMVRHIQKKVAVTFRRSKISSADNGIIITGYREIADSKTP